MTTRDEVLAEYHGYSVDSAMRDYGTVAMADEIIRLRSRQDADRIMLADEITRLQKEIILLTEENTRLQGLVAGERMIRQFKKPLPELLDAYGEE